MSQNNHAVLAAKISQAVQDIGWIGKDGVHVQGWKYASAEAVNDAVNAALHKNKVLAIASIDECEHHEIASTKGVAGIRTDVWVRITLIDTESGHSIESRFPAIGIDYGDKSSNKALTFARKYGLLTMIGIARGEDPDGQDVAPFVPTQGAKPDKPAKPLKTAVANTPEQEMKIAVTCLYKALNLPPDMPPGDKAKIGLCALADHYHLDIIPTRWGECSLEQVQALAQAFEQANALAENS